MGLDPPSCSAHVFLPAPTAPTGERRDDSCGAAVGHRDRPATRAQVSAPVGDNATWYREAIIYQLHVRAFFDADADGRATSAA